MPDKIKTDLTDPAMLAHGHMTTRTIALVNMLNLHLHGAIQSQLQRNWYRKYLPTVYGVRLPGFHVAFSRCDKLQRNDFGFPYLVVWSLVYD